MGLETHRRFGGLVKWLQATTKPIIGSIWLFLYRGGQWAAADGKNVQRGGGGMKSKLKTAQVLGTFKVDDSLEQM